MRAKGIMPATAPARLKMVGTMSIIAMLMNMTSGGKCSVP